MLVDHSVNQRELGISRTAREMTGWLLVNGSNSIQQQLCKETLSAMSQPVFGRTTDEAPCYIRPNLTHEGMDFFSVRAVLMAMGVSLDSGSYNGRSVRYEGLTATLAIQYFNTWPWHGVLKKSSGSDDVSYVYSLIPQAENPYKVTTIIWLAYPTRRVRQNAHGLYLAVVPTESLAAFDLQTLLLTLTTSLTLLAMGSVVVKYLAMYVLQQREYYKEMLVQVSADFSDVRHLESKSDEELAGIMRDKGLAVQGSRVQMILAILNAGLPDQNPPSSQSSHNGSARLLEAVGSQVEVQIR
ncbi:unnamed protein product [Polarella glacialis]|uniref:Uncharacterized protein n=1 Tax=Polarella glacialis TaxID=89957 RepID=A0A813FNI0_POLGL|nr:unnamed protein product [Polarella glacialis]